eukprot:Opistho-1_new@21061
MLARVACAAALFVIFRIVFFFFDLFLCVRCVRYTLTPRCHSALDGTLYISALPWSLKTAPIVIAACFPFSRASSLRGVYSRRAFSFRLRVRNSQQRELYAMKLLLEKKKKKKKKVLCVD